MPGPVCFEMSKDVDRGHLGNRPCVAIFRVYFDEHIFIKQVRLIYIVLITIFRIYWPTQNISHLDI